MIVTGKADSDKREWDDAPQEHSQHQEDLFNRRSARREPDFCGRATPPAPAAGGPSPSVEQIRFDWLVDPLRHTKTEPAQ